MTKGNPLKQIPEVLTHEYMLYAIAASVFIGSYYARAAVSIATGVLGVIAILSLFDAEKRKAFLSDKANLALSAVFLVFVLSGINSANTTKWLSVLDINLPYLLIPAGLFAFGPLDRNKLYKILLLFIYVTAFSAVIMLVDYVANFREYTDLYGVGKTIPTPIRHIRYSLFLALAGVVASGMLGDRIATNSNSKYALVIPGIIIIVAVHVLAVRTGVVSLYAGWLGLIIAYVIREKNWKIATAAVMAVLLLGFLSINFIPSLKQKMAYMKYDLEQLKGEEFDPDYSDNVRLISIRNGLTVWKENPVFGVGIGDIDDEIFKTYDRDTPQMPQENRYTPISQYVYWLSAMGLVGTLILLALLWTPAILNFRESYLIVGIYFAIFASIIGETSIQLQLGKTLFLFLVCLLLNYRRWQVLR